MEVWRMNGLRQIFRERCINVSEFAKKIGVPRTTLYNALNDNAKTGRMGIDVYLAICEGLDEDPREFYYEIKRREDRIEYAVVGLGDGETDD